MFCKNVGRAIFPQLAYAEMSFQDMASLLPCFAAILLIVLYALALFPETFLILIITDA